jgi:hypothetical protein
MLSEDRISARMNPCPDGPADHISRLAGMVAAVKLGGRSITVAARIEELKRRVPAAR